MTPEELRAKLFGTRPSAILIKEFDPTNFEPKAFDPKNMPMMDYKSPIEIIHGEIETKIENDIMTAVQHYGIRVDKEELIKALQYDRKQYEQGYEDARRAFKRPQGVWISDYRTCKCSVCNFTTVIDTYNFCPNCGAIMSLPKEEETE